MKQIDVAERRRKQIDELNDWAKKNTDYGKIIPEDAIKFFDSDREKLQTELQYVNKIFEEIVKHAKSKMKLGNFQSTEYANTIILKKTDGADIKKIREHIELETTLINPPMSNSSKISLIQKTVLEINKQQNNENVDYDELVNELIKSGKFTKDEAEANIETAIKRGAIIKTDSNHISL